MYCTHNHVHTPMSPKSKRGDLLLNLLTLPKALQPSLKEAKLALCECIRKMDFYLLFLCKITEDYPAKEVLCRMESSRLLHRSTFRGITLITDWCTKHLAVVQHSRTLHYSPIHQHARVCILLQYPSDFGILKSRTLGNLKVLKIEKVTCTSKLS